MDNAQLILVTGGTGTFDNANSLTPVYTAGAGETGAVTLTFTATPNGSCGIVADNVVVTINPPVVVSTAGGTDL